MNCIPRALEKQVMQAGGQTKPYCRRAAVIGN
jgi:hypothetical protein